MMKNKKLLSLFGGLFIVGVTALTSCGGGDVAGADTIKWKDKEESLSFRRVRAARGYNDTKSTNRTLIIPVDFTDFPRENVYGNKREEDGARIDLYKVNFGKMIMLTVIYFFVCFSVNILFIYPLNEREFLGFLN